MECKSYSINSGKCVEGHLERLVVCAELHTRNFQKPFREASADGKFVTG
jgi:hypothetical protein